MKFGHACAKLAAALAECADAGQTADDLLAWLNIAEPNDMDIQRVCDLHASGLFESWECPTCGIRVYIGHPEEWGAFQGVRQADYASYPLGSRWQCDHCRCHYPDASAELARSK